MDDNLYTSLNYIKENNVEGLLLDNFTTKWDNEDIELKVGGKEVEVCEANKAEYIELMCEYMLVKRYAA